MFLVNVKWKKDKKIINMVRTHLLKNYICLYEEELTKNLHIKILTIGISPWWDTGDFYFLLCLWDKHVLQDKHVLTTLRIRTKKQYVVKKWRAKSQRWFLAVTADKNVCANSAPFTASLPSKELYPVCDNIIHCNGKGYDALAWSVTSRYSSATGNKDTRFFFHNCFSNNWQLEEMNGRKQLWADKMVSRSDWEMQRSQSQFHSCSDFRTLQRYYCFVFNPLLKSLLFLPAVTQFFAGSSDPQYVFDSVTW